MHYDHPSDEGWIPANINRHGISISLAQLTSIQCNECGYYVIVPKRDYQDTIDRHIQDHFND